MSGIATDIDSTTLDSSYDVVAQGEVGSSVMTDGGGSGGADTQRESYVSNVTASSSLQTQMPQPVANHTHTNIAYMLALRRKDRGRSSRSPSPTRTRDAELGIKERGVDRSPGVDRAHSPIRSNTYSLDGTDIGRGGDDYDDKRLGHSKDDKGKQPHSTMRPSAHVLDKHGLVGSTDSSEKYGYTPTKYETCDKVDFADTNAEKLKLSNFSDEGSQSCITKDGGESIPSDSVTAEARSALSGAPAADDGSHHVPGAHYVLGTTPTDFTTASASFGVNSTDDTNRQPLSRDQPIEQLIAAHLVDTDEEEQRIRDLEAQNRRFREREQNVVFAQVVDKGELIKSLFNLRDPEYRRQKLLGLGFIVLALVAVILGIVLKESGPSATPAPTPEPTTLGQLALSEFLADEASFDDGSALYNQSTPQYQAAKWLANNNTSVDVYSDDQKIQRYVLATLYFSTNGDNWTNSTNWLDDEDECGRWWQGEGKTLSCTNGAVDTLYLDTNGLEGSLPPELALLSNSLEMIGFKENMITGTLPTELGYLSKLRSLNVDGSLISGTIVTELGLLTRLGFLGMENNDLSGSIPTELFRLDNLKTLRLGTRLTGSIPSGIGTIASLTELWLHSNMLTGALPSEIGLLTRMSNLHLYSNQLSSTIPSTIGLMTSLEWLYLDVNNLVGTLPTQVENLTRVKDFWVSVNALSGTIPTTFGLMESVTQLHLDDNSFSGPIPSELGLLSESMDQLVLGDNAFLTGTIPSELLLLEFMTVLFLQGNTLTGTIPEDIGTLTNLIHLSLHSNEFTGTIPSSIHNLTHLETLWLQDNALTGPFTCPSEIPVCTVSCDDAENEMCRVLV